MNGSVRSADKPPLFSFQVAFSYDLPIPFINYDVTPSAFELYKRRKLYISVNDEYVVLDAGLLSPLVANFL